jgi:guanylate kinase
MADIFISYTNEDRSRAEPLANMLRKQGLTVWWDRTIPAGEDFDEVIEEELSKARCVIVIWTNKSIKSKYVKGEARDGLGRGILVPVEMEPGIRPPFDFRSTSTISLIDWEGSDTSAEFQKLVSDISRYIAQEEGRRRKESEPNHKEVKAEIKPDRPEPAKVKLSAPITNDKLTAATKCLFVLSGPSGAGKDVLIHRLIRRLEAGGYSATNLRRFTTREPRPDEIADTPFTYLSHQKFIDRVNLKKISCVHTSLGHTYGCDSHFAEDAPPKTTIFYSMRLYNFLPEIKQEAEAFGVNVRNILVMADQDSIKARILMRSSSSKDKLSRIETSLNDLSWLNSNEDFKESFFDKIVDNSDTSKLKEVEENIYKYVKYTIEEITKLRTW